jgi:PPK2 family polyphosphate:nucleotide phosphotransferase
MEIHTDQFKYKHTFPDHFLSSCPTAPVQEVKGRNKDYDSLISEIQKMQQKLYAGSASALLVIIQGMDGSGKDSVTRHVFGPLNPQGVRVYSFKQPEPSEASRDFLWRIHREVPPKGYITVFNRSHYEEVLIVRVRQLKPESMWQKHYDHIRHFEQLLTDTGTRILKIFLHISPEEQLLRLRERETNPEKRWKFHAADYEERQYWEVYQRAYEEAMIRCHSEQCPWYIVPADHKPYRDWIVANLLKEQLGMCLG